MGINDCWIPFRYIGSSTNYVSHQFTIWMSAVTETLDYFMWEPEEDEVYFSENINLFSEFSGN